MAWSNSVAYGAAATGPVVRDERRATGAENPTVSVSVGSTDHGSITAAFVADPTVRDGVVSITHGHPHANPGDLTSGDVGVDQLTAMPRVAGLEVEITRPDAEVDDGNRL